jgi:putative pyoverdin transport system ATP-binding/permease protein
MSFFQLVRREMHSSLPKLVFMSGLAGLSTAAILTAINAGVQGVESGKKASLWSVSLFVVSLFLFIKTQHYVTIATTAEIESIIHKLRLRLLDQIRRSELLAIERIGRSRIVAAISSDTAVLTQASNILCFSVQGIVLVFFVAIYVAYLSLAAFAMSAIIVVAAAIIFHIKNRSVSAQAREAAEREGQLFGRLIDFLDGFKEVRLNNKRSADLFDDAFEVSRSAAEIKIRSQSEILRQIVFTHGALFILLGAIVFVAPNFTDSSGGASITKTTTALLFVVGACFGLVQSIPILLAADAAADRIEQMESSLSATAVFTEERGGKVPKLFDKIEMRDIVFRYVDRLSDAAFQIGPLDFILRSGDLVFITGGNGSGKSTFLKVLAGLYPADSGEFTLDGARIKDDTLDKYRALISAVFTDYHLFRRLYGVPEPDPAEFDRLLTEFRLTAKTALLGGEFSSLDLSGGQRKRLALIVSLLEKRPILLLDEWTSDQDPEFRRKFYHDLLPELMRAGVTIVAITHDDRYLDELDLPTRRLRMDEGRFVEQRSMQTAW